MGEYLEKKPYVSRTHARLTPEEDGLWVENLSNTNYTYVNNRRITEKTRLQPGDELALGGTNMDGNRQEQAAYFTVGIQA
jgi:pSer/pThr/pTyr-binding forkhead associated (FHA) protein